MAYLGQLVGHRFGIQNRTTGSGGSQAGFSALRYVLKGFHKTNRVRRLLAPPVPPLSWGS
jgi:hypothetical protein